MDWDNQKMLEYFFNARQTPKLLRQELLGSKAVMDQIARSELPEDFALELLAHMILAKRSPVPALVGLLKGHFPTQHNPGQKTAEAIQAAVMADLVDWDPERDQVVVRYDADQATHDLIRQYQFLPPMIVPPLKVTGLTGRNRGSGYLTILNDSLLLKDNHHNGELCPDSLNRFNAIPLKLNVEVAKRVNNAWKHLDHPKLGETFEEFQKRIAAFDRYQKDTAFTMALMVEMGNEFYITHKYDKRGRTYCMGYHVSYQGNCWSKAVIELADEEHVQ